MSMKQVIQAPDGPKVKSPLSHAVRVGDLVFVSGMPPYFGDREFAKDDFDAQFHQVMRNLKAVLSAAGSDLGKVVKTTVLLTRQEDFWRMNDLYRQYFGDTDHPARTTMVAGLGIPGMLLEIECVATV